MSRTLRRPLIPFLVVAMLAACGSDEDPDSTGDPDATTAPTDAPAATDAPTSTDAPDATEAATGTDAPAATEAPSDTAPAPADGEPIKVSIIGIVSGSAGSPYMSTGAEAAATAINNAGGVDGRPIEILACDGMVAAIDPTAGVNCANEAIEAGVVATVSKVNADDNVTTAFIDAGIPSIAPFPLGTGDLTLPGAFPFKGVSELQGVAANLVENGATSIKLIAYQSSSTGFTVALANTALAPRGLDIGEPIQVPPDPSIDYAPFIAQATTGTDGLILAFPRDGALKVIKGARAAGYTGLFGLPAQVLTPDLVEALGDDAEGIITASDFEAITSDSEGMQQFLAEMDEFDPDAPLDQNAMNGWAAVHFVADVLATLPTIDGPTLLDALPGATVDIGIKPPFALTSIDNAFGMPNIFTSTVQYQVVKDGEVVAIGDGEFRDPAIVD